MYVFSVLLHASKVNVILSFISLNLYENRLEKSCEVTFFNVQMARLTIRKCIVFVVCGGVKIQKFVLLLSSAVHVVQYFKL